VRFTADFVVITKWLYETKELPKQFIPGEYRNCAFSHTEIHETKADWIRRTRIDWPLRRKWFKLKYGLPVIEIIQGKKGEITIKGGAK